ncbi:MAG: DUF3144 domain-containing protein [Sphingomonadales bacterium]
MAEEGEQSDPAQQFAELSNRFIDIANRANKTVPAPEVHLPFLYAAARYGAFVAKAALKVTDHEAYVEEMSRRYAEMLRRHLADPGLD